MRVIAQGSITKMKERQSITTIIIMHVHSMWDYPKSRYSKGRLINMNGLAKRITNWTKMLLEHSVIIFFVKLIY